LVLIMLWLPLQGATAVSILMCAHEKTAGVINNDVIPAIDNHPHTVRHEQPIDSSMIYSQEECGVNTLCHTSCGAVVASIFPATIFFDSFSSYTVSLVSSFTSFYPEQLQRPPLA